MIKNAFGCPYCDRQVAIDCGTGEIVFNPDGPKGSPCSHLACFWICLSFDQAAAGRTRSWVWTWERGIARIGADAPLRDVALVRYIMDCGSGILEAELWPAERAFQIVGGSAAGRESQTPGAGEFFVEPDRQNVAILDGWGIFSPAPQALMVEIERIWDGYEV